MYFASQPEDQIVPADDPFYDDITDQFNGAEYIVQIVTPELGFQVPDSTQVTDFFYREDSDQE